MIQDKRAGEKTENGNGTTQRMPERFEIEEGFQGICRAHITIAERVINEESAPDQAKVAVMALKGITDLMKVRLNGSAQMERAQTMRQKAQIAATLDFNNNNNELPAPQGEQH